MAREDDLNDLLALLPSAAVRSGGGWPANVTFHDGVRQAEVTVYVSRVGEPGMGAVGARSARERRWQNPGQGHPIRIHPRQPTLLLGLADRETFADGTPVPPVIAAFDAARHADRTTRISVQMHVETLRAAGQRGHATQLRKNGELIVAFRPEFMGIYLDSVAPLVHRGERVSPQDADEVEVLFELLEPTEAEEDPTPQSWHASQAERRERARAIAYRRARDARFSRNVRQAYAGHCAMCGIQLGLVVGAHIEPVEADGPDDVRNGLALCPTHHAAFDSHLVLIEEEEDFAITLNEDRLEYLRAIEQSEGLENFMADLRESLLLPTRPQDRPHPNYFKRRREYYFHPEEAEFYEGEDEDL